MSLLNREVDYFLAICEAGSIGRAAEALGISQPALTLALQRLEARFGARLFHRTSRGVEPTSIGSAIRARVDKARIALDDAEREAAQMAAGKVGQLRVGAGHLPAQLVSRALFPRLVVERPAARIQLHVAFNVELFERLESGRLDLALCAVGELPHGLDFRELFATGMTVVVRRGHPLSRIAKPTLRDLVKYRGAAPTGAMAARHAMEQRLSQLGLAMQPDAVESNSWDAILGAVAATDLYTMAPLHDVMRHSWATKLVAIDVQGLDITIRTGLATRVGAYLSPLAQRAIELIEDAIGTEVRDVRQKALRNPTPSRARPAG